MIHSLPSRFNERNFRRYEAVIASAVSSFPTPQRINPAPLAVETYAARFRDAMTSYERQNWSSIVIDRERFKAIRPELKVRITGSSVLIGPAVATPTPITTSNDSRVRIMSEPTTVEIEVEVTNLLFGKYEQIRIATTSTDLQTFILALPKRYDVAVTQDKNVFIII